ncbi:MAG TPA: radical SAM protein [Dehalococcoidia bacterium]|nr:radical SAM protein [Dehalococcoidia bacterium]
MSRAPKSSFEKILGKQRNIDRSLPFWRVWYKIRASWRHMRVSKLATRLLGRQYQRSRDMIEIDITYLCNLHCLNCNRSVSQARESLHMPVSTITQFVEDSISRGKEWRRIRILGGEPTFHPDFHKIIKELQLYGEMYPDCIIEVVTNGNGARVKHELAQLPREIWIDNSNKNSHIQPHFGPFNLAPVDDPLYNNTDFSNGCAVMQDCGMGLTPTGYYPCAVAGGIDRVLKANLGVQTLPDDEDNMTKAASELCKLCGRFRDGHYIPEVLRPELTEEKISETWEGIYARWHEESERSEGFEV